MNKKIIYFVLIIAIITLNVYLIWYYKDTIKNEINKILKKNKKKPETKHQLETQPNLLKNFLNTLFLKTLKYDNSLKTLKSHKQKIRKKSEKRKKRKYLK